jgi:hypothetical protein
MNVADMVTRTRKDSLAILMQFKSLSNERSVPSVQPCSDQHRRQGTCGSLFPADMAMKAPASHARYLGKYDPSVL